MSTLQVQSPVSPLWNKMRCLPASQNVFIRIESVCFPVSSAKYRRNRRSRGNSRGKQREMNSALVVLQKLDWLLNFWNAAASGTIPAAGPAASIEVPTRGTVPLRGRGGHVFLTSRQVNAADLCSICLWALMLLAAAGVRQCHGLGSRALRTAPLSVNSNRELFDLLTERIGCASRNYSHKKDYWDSRSSSAAQLEEGRDVIWSNLRKCKSSVWCFNCPEQPLMPVLPLKKEREPSNEKNL